MSGFEVPLFSRDAYNMWKKKMLLFIKLSNPAYMKILESGSCVPKKTIPGIAATSTSSAVSEVEVPKDPFEYTDKEKEAVLLDANLQLIIFDSMDDDMSHQLMNCESAKHMWDTIELIMVGTQEYQLDILTSRYEAFKSLPGESITQVFERYYGLLNQLSAQGKKYPLRETNRKFMLTMPRHLEHQVSAIRERPDFKTMSLAELYWKLKIYEMEQEQRKIIYGTKF
ncbi:uncharacterized protein LOC108217742 [Daucus carota subsp. sativus]|uniref:uncharacterized protein LOC108217742 n=1 Tax=Daucus carota subsp. sativus TaxID=79200 RepID=UPI0007EF8311|nr:PREDICTED: uncharacterized protein LOC108217742 [Daucus carota subsp. sativus]XP_017246112.1 PREDICTED: uncharacterized protein LOC108217742 [Daucus carota subsp. sativus]